MFKRNISEKLTLLSQQYPVLTLTGPRQSGKTTLCRHLFPDMPYVTLEDPDQRNRALSDPRSFLGQFSEGAVLDEIQRVPELLSYIQGIVDTHKKRTGLFVLTGSAQFELMSSLTQSLAGRTALATVLPFALDEVFRLGEARNDDNRLPLPPLSALMYQGMYPRLYDLGLNPTEMYKFYFATYIERDVRQLLGVRDLLLFEQFVRLCAARSGQILNLKSLGEDCGVSHNTARDWISVLEASYIIFRALPRNQNINKRLTKSPKLYFFDVGLAAYLIGIENPRQIETHPLRGALFETLIASEFHKARANLVKDPALFFLRDSAGKEVDILAETKEGVAAIECKSGATFSNDMLKGLTFYRKLDPAPKIKELVFYGGDSSFEHQGVSVRRVADLPEVAKELFSS